MRGDDDEETGRSGAGEGRSIADNAVVTGGRIESCESGSGEAASTPRCHETDAPRTLAPAPATSRSNPASTPRCHETGAPRSYSLAPATVPVHAAPASPSMSAPFAPITDLPVNSSNVATLPTLPTGRAVAAALAPAAELVPFPELVPTLFRATGTLGITRQQVFDALDYSPTPAQLEILDDRHSTQLVAGGYRGGKSRTASMKALLTTLQFISNYRERAAGQVAWLVASEYDATRAEFMHPDGSLSLDLEKLWPGVTFSNRVDPGEIRVPVPSADGAYVAGHFTIRTRSAFDPSSLGMESPVWIILCEAARVTQDVYHRLRSRCSEARRRFPGFGWLHMEGTFEGSLGWYPALWTRWQSAAIQEREDASSFSLPSHSNTALFPGGIDDPQIAALRRVLPESKFLERHMGVPVPPSGRVHSAFSPGLHVGPVQYDPALPVYIGIDPGYSGQPSTYAVEVCQLRKFENGHRQWRVVDEIAINRHSMPGFTVADVCDVAMSRPWWRNSQKTGVIDVAGTAHAGAQESNAEVWRRRTGLVLMHEKVSILPGIDRFDTCLKVDEQTAEPGLLIDPSCELVISELGGGPNPFDGQSHLYRWATDRAGNVVGRVPRDEYCDGIKALTYLFINVMGYAGRERNPAMHRPKIKVRSRKRAA